LKGLAKFLSFLYLLAYIIVILGTIVLAIGTVVLFVGLDISFINEAIKSGAMNLPAIGGETLTPEMLAQFRMPITITLIGTLISCVLGLRTIRMVRRALRETGHGTPFSTVTIKSLRQAGILSLIAAVVSIVFPVIGYVMFSELLGSQVTFSATSACTLIFNALIMFLLSSIAKYGNQYVPDDEVLPPPAGNPYDDTEVY
jgi:hypothetical protein